MKSSTALLSLLALASGARATILPRENAQGLLGEPIVMETKVPVVLGVMSACPDALACEAVFDRVLKQVGRRVDLGLTFVAKVNETEPEFGVTCKHGPRECAGNVQQLCVAKYHEQAKWWAFVQCQNYEGRYKIGEPALALRCARAAGIDWEGSGVSECAGKDASGKAEEEISLLKESAGRTEELGVTKSCTVLISGKQVCLRDATWKQCEGGHQPEDFVRQINAEYRRLNEQ